jgi:hypothetical protein
MPAGIDNLRSSRGRRVECHLAVKFRFEGNWVFQASLKFDPVSVPEVWAIRWVMKE